MIERRKVRILSVLAVGCIAVLLAGGTARADLASEFNGYDSINEVGVSGLRSSYHQAIRAGDPLPDFMFTLGPDRVSYPHGIGTVPSPGGSTGRAFDNGRLGVRVENGLALIRMAGALNPLTGRYYGGWHTWYSQGDLFLTVEDSAGISQFALLNAWPRDGSTPRSLNGGHFTLAQAFHTQGGAGGSSLEGHLVRLAGDADVALAGGSGAYYVGYNPAPVGLDYRTYAQGGLDIGDAALAHTSTIDTGLGGVDMTWYIQTWTVPLGWLSSDSTFTIGLHSAASCGNDQIGMIAQVGEPPIVPAPGAFVLASLGLATVGWLKRRGLENMPA
ncbi:MAG: hypothetical protein J7M21_04165 [Planctomycetes bacterium]|nr:hypothetical protein [Planctomycetota bacterium]